jgi:FdrA protein
MAYLRRHLASLHSNAAIAGVAQLADGTASTHNSLIDMGADEFTRGRVHPMLDPAAIAKRVIAEARDPEVAVVLFDVILGYGAHPDPASVLASAVTASREELRTIGRRVVYLAHVCGTASDPQGRDKQEAALREGGIVVLPTNAAMARMALWIVRQD